MLAQICCYESKLPQGAPTSPIISNMICSKIDNELHRLAIKHKCRYTRYADDITFSSQAYDFPSALAKIGSQGEVELGNELESVINSNWFEVNDDKIRLRRKNLRQQVTGLIVNEKVNVKRRYVSQIRAMLHSWEKEGLDTAEQEFLKRHYKKHRAPFKSTPSFIKIIKGKIGFLGMVIGKDNPVYLRYYRQYKRLCLLKMYEELGELEDHKKRGYLLQDLLNMMFEFDEIPATRSFMRNDNGEQIDGGFELEGWHFIVECRWRDQLTNIRELDGLYGQIDRSGTSVKGLFLSINGWSENVPKLLKQNQRKAIILMNGNDIVCVLKDRIDLLDFIKINISPILH